MAGLTAVVPTGARTPLRGRLGMTGTPAAGNRGRRRVWFRVQLVCASACSLFLRFSYCTVKLAVALPTIPFKDASARA